MIYIIQKKIEFNCFWSIDVLDLKNSKINYWTAVKQFAEICLQKSLKLTSISAIKQ